MIFLKKRNCSEKMLFMIRTIDDVSFRGESTMAQYVNLKDYFQNEHIKLIQDTVSDYLRNDVQITETVIQSLACTDDDAEYNAEFEIGVSVKALGVKKTADLSFIVTVRGNLEQRFRDINIKEVRRVTSNMFPEDNILSQFILPDIHEDEIERIGSDLYNFFQNMATLKTISFLYHFWSTKESSFLHLFRKTALGELFFLNLMLRSFRMFRQSMV